MGWGLIVSATLALVLLGTAVAQPPFVARTDWTQFRFDNNRTGVQPFESILDPTNVPMLQLAWQAQLGKLVDYSSPAIVDGVVYIGSTDGRLWAYPAGGCGQSMCTVPLWTSTSIAQIMDSPTVANGRVYVGSQTSDTSNDGKLDVFSSDGCGKDVCAPLWQGDAGPESILQSSPAVSKDGEARQVDWQYVKNKIRDVLARFVYEQTRRRPMILPLVMEV